VQRPKLRDHLEQRGFTLGPKQWPGNPPLQPGRFNVMFDPFKAAPVHEPAGGGVLYFQPADRGDFAGYAQLLALTRGFSDGYAVFVSTLYGPKRHQDRRYLAQLRAVSIEALQQQFGIRDLRDEWGRPLPPVQQPSGLVDLLWEFVLHQKTFWGTRFWDTLSPASALGGDGEYEREQLAFGMMSEAPGIARVWSRAWLVER